MPNRLKDLVKKVIAEVEADPNQPCPFCLMYDGHQAHCALPFLKGWYAGQK